MKKPVWMLWMAPGQMACHHLARAACSQVQPPISILGTTPATKKSVMDNVCEEILKLILMRLPPLDTIKAKSVCRRWRDLMKAEGSHFQFAEAQSYCPLVFRRLDEEHNWSGFCSVTGQWEQLPSLSNVPRVIRLLPFAGSGKGFLGFEISTEFSSYLVGDPYKHKWKTLPKSADEWGHAGMFVVSDVAQNSFRVVAILDKETHIYNSNLNRWARVEWTSPCVSAETVKQIKSKFCAVLCGGLLYCIGGSKGNFLISFNLKTEMWTRDCIQIPTPTGGTSTVNVQLVECAGKVFAVIESNAKAGISVWALGMVSRKFFPVLEMPETHRLGLVSNNVSRDGLMNKADKLKCVGHGYRLFFWRHKGLNIVAFNLVLRTWEVLPQVESPSGMDEEVVIDTGFFEPLSAS